MHYKNLFVSGLLLALSLPLQVLGDRGRISFYEDAPTSSRPGACGKEYLADYYVALNDEQLDRAKSSYCGKCVKIVYNNKYLVGRINDRCPGCPSHGLDISPKMFDFFVGHSNRDRIGVVQADWSLVSCDMYGQSGDVGSERKTTTKKTTTTTRKTTTTTTRKTTTTTTQKVISTTTTHVPTSSPVTPPSPSSSAPAVTNETTTVALSEETPVNETPNNANAPEVTKNAPVEIKPAVADASKSSSKETKDDKKEEGGNTAGYVVPITGAVMVSGAAGIGLLYMKRENRYKDLSSQIKNITRSITTRGSSLGRRVTRSITRKKPTQPTLPTTHVPSEVIDVSQPTEVN